MALAIDHGDNLHHLVPQHLHHHHEPPKRVVVGVVHVLDRRASSSRIFGGRSSGAITATGLLFASHAAHDFCAIEMAIRRRE